MKNYLLPFLIQVIFSTVTLGQIQFSVTYGEIIKTQNGIKTFNKTFEFAMVDFFIESNKSKFNIHFFQTTRDSIIELKVDEFEQIGDAIGSDKKILTNQWVVKNNRDGKIYVLFFHQGVVNESVLNLEEYDLSTKEFVGNELTLRNVKAVNREIHSFLSNDGLSLFVNNSNKSNVLNGGYFMIPRNQISDKIKLLYTSDEVLLKEEKENLTLRFPLSNHMSYLIRRDISRNVTIKDGIYTYKNDSIYGNNISTYGFMTGDTSSAGFNKFKHSWFFPDNIEILSYQCNRPGYWKKDQNALIFYGNKGINNVLFTISYRLKNLPAKEIEKTSVVLREKISVPASQTKVHIWDKNMEDGDIISLSLNGEWIIRNLEVRKCPTTFHVNLKQGENFLVMKAENIGKTPPNTAAFYIQSGGISKEIVLNSDMGKSEMIQIDVK